MNLICQLCGVVWVLDRITIYPEEIDYGWYEVRIFDTNYDFIPSQELFKCVMYYREKVAIASEKYFSSS